MVTLKLTRKYESIDNTKTFKINNKIDDQNNINRLCKSDNIDNKNNNEQIKRKRDLNFPQSRPRSKKLVLNNVSEQPPQVIEVKKEMMRINNNMNQKQTMATLKSTKPPEEKVRLNDVDPNVLKVLPKKNDEIQPFAINKLGIVTPCNEFASMKWLQYVLSGKCK